MNIFRVLAFLISFLLSSTMQYAQGQDEQLCREWKYVGYEEFGVVKKPAKGQENDGISFMCDEAKTAFVTKGGEAKSGTWEMSKGYIHITENGSEVKQRLKFISIDASRLVLEYQGQDLVRTKYHYEPVAR